MKVELTDEQIVATILDKLVRRRVWGQSYLPMDSVVKWIASKIKRDGKRVRRIMKDLIKERILLTKKSGAVISLNPEEFERIMEIRRRVLSRSFQSFEF